MFKREIKIGTRQRRNEMLAQAIGWILFGFCLVLLEIALELWGDTQAGTPPTESMFNEHFLHFFTRACEATGIAALVFGMFSIFIELPGLRAYFLDRMKELVTDKAYLKNLSDAELKLLQLDVIRANFHIDEVEDRGHFIDFISTEIHHYIAEPYREKVTLEIRYEEIEGGRFLAHDRMSYICRASGGKIIPHIIWQNDPGEIECIRELSVRVKYPKASRERVEVGETQEGELIAGRNEDNKFFVADKNGNKRYVEDINKEYLGKELRLAQGEAYKNVDQMRVIIEAEYLVPASRFHYWLMSYPTKDFSLILKFPDTFRCQAATFINNEHVGVLTEEKGYYSYFYNSWMIPQSGVAWRLIPAGELPPKAKLGPNG